MPLWLQGAFESAQIMVMSAVVVVVPLFGVWATGGFADKSIAALATLSGQAWMVVHGVPLTLTVTDGPSSASVQTGILHLVPYGLTLIPFLLAWRAGRRLARASYTDQLWQPLLGALVVYAGAGLATAFVCSVPGVGIPLLAGTLVPLIPAGLGLVIGARREAGSWGRLIGVNAAGWITKASQQQRWAGSYAWAVVRGGFVGFLASMALAAVLLSVNLAVRWADIVSVYQGLQPGVVGGSVLTIAQLGYLPNLAVWALAWASGAGFALGAGSTVTPLATTVAPVPPIPVLAAIPTGDNQWALAALALPVLAGILAGWWFVRTGENHVDEWLSIKLPSRWLSLPLSTLFLGAVTGVCAAIPTFVAAWLAHGSVGLGRLTTLGPDPLTTAAWVGAEVGVGVVAGSVLGPWLEREPAARKAAE
nr:DUF6350 family protein [Specibacter cremeus]